MNIIETLISHLNRKVWYNSLLDRTGIYRSLMLSTNRGGVDSISTPLVSYDLPDSTNRYILVTLDVVPVQALNLDTIGTGWVPVSTLISKNIWFTAVRNGRRFTLAGAFIKITEHSEVLIAFSYANNLQVTTLTTPIFVKFYSNAYFGTNTGRGNTLSLFSYTFSGSSTLLNYNTFCSTNISPANALVFKNGLFLPVGLPAYSSLIPGDIVEFINDPSITDVHLIPLTSMPVYTSAADSVNKMIASLDLVNDTAFIQDIDFYVIGTTAGGTVEGLSFLRLDNSVIRQLTYKDFGLNSQLIQNAVTDLISFTDVVAATGINILIVRRTIGIPRVDINDSNYLSDLMQLPAVIRQNVMTGVNANLPIWQASNIESCPFNSFIQHLNLPYITSNYFGVYTQREAYNYLENLTKRDTGNYFLPPICLGTGQLVEFDSSGKNPTLNLVSTITEGLGWDSDKHIFLPFTDSVSGLDILIAANDATDTVVSGNFDILCLYNDGTLKIATPGIDYTLTDNNTTDLTTITWSTVAKTYPRVIRSAANGIAFTVTVDESQLIAGIDVYNGFVPANDLGMGSLLVWANGDYLIYGLDYVMFESKLFISSQRNSWTLPMSLTVLYVGLPNTQLSYQDNTTFGFVKYESILEDSVYDLIGFRDKLLVVDGAVYDLNQINAKEQYQDNVDVNTSPWVNGTSFAVIDRPHVARVDLILQLTNTAVYESEMDVSVSNLLTVVDPQPIPSTANVIPQMYVVVSLLMQKLITDITSGVLLGLVLESYTEETLYPIVEPYIWMLHVDLTHANLDTNYVVFAPCWNAGPQTVSSVAFSFLNAVNTIILGGKVQRLGSYLSIG